MNIIAILALALVVSASVNVYQFGLYTEGKTELGQLQEAKAQAVADAEACGKGVADLQDMAERQAKLHQKAIQDAQRQRHTVTQQAEAERNRAPAVAGDVCASVEAETREWLARRRITQ